MNQPTAVGLSLGPGPLTRATFLDLPPAVRFGMKIEALRAALERDLLRAVAQKLAGTSARRTELLAAVEHDIDILVRAIRRWLDVDFEGPTVRLFRPLRIELDPRLRGAQNRRRAAAAKTVVEAVRILAELKGLLDETPRLEDLERGTVFARWPKQVDAFEQALSPGVTAFAFLSERLAEDTAQDLVGWLQLVRLGAAVAVVRAVAFRRVWGPVPGLSEKAEFRDGLYGTLGYTLAERAAELAAGVAEHPLFESLREREPYYPWMARYVTFSGDPQGVQYPIGREIGAVAAESTAWRLHCHREGCTQQDKGLVWPFEFTPLTGEEHGDRSLAGKQPDHMYARPAATLRVLQARHNWRFVHRLMKLPDDTLQFKVNAASLRWGGAHPPHRTHRDGAMFDLDLTVPGNESLDPVCMRKAAVIFGEPVIEGQPREESILVQMKRLLASIFTLMEPTPDEDPTDVLEFCASDFLYAKERRVAGQKPEVIARRYTQCMLLTFPSQVLFASWVVLRDAWNGLFDRVNELVAANDRALGDEGKAALAKLRSFFDTPAPGPKPSKSHFKRLLYPRDDHDDHWHVSYNPDDLEDDKFERAKTLLWISNHLELLFPEEKIDE